MQSRDYLNTLVQIRMDELQQSTGSPVSDNVLESIESVIDKELDNSALDVIRYANLNELFSIIADGSKAHEGTGKKTTSTRVIFNSDKSGTIPIPVNYERFVSLKMSDWSNDIQHLESYMSDAYHRQKNNRITQGSYDSPVGIFYPFTNYTEDEKEPYSVAKTFTTNQTLSALFNGEEVDSYTISTDDILVLSGQSTSTENGIYQANSSGSPTKLGEVSELTPDTPKACIQFHRCKTNSATIEHFFYIPKKKAEEMPDILLDALTWVCASRVFITLRDTTAGQLAEQKAKELLVSQNKGVK